MNRSLLCAASRHLQSASHVHKAPAASLNAPVRSFATAFNWEDPLAASELYTEEELAIQDTARQYCQERLLPRVLGMRSLPLAELTPVYESFSSLHRGIVDMHAN